MQPSVAEFEEIRRRTEALWADAAISPGIYGYQIQPGTRWNPGLSAAEIEAYERTLGVSFPVSFRCMLSVMNGTDLPTINVYGSSGHPPSERPGVHAYPRDLALVQSMIADLREDRAEIADVLREQGFHLAPDASLVPVNSHRFLVCGSDPDEGAVLSIMGTDAIVYVRGLAEYLCTEFYTAAMLEEVE